MTNAEAWFNIALRPQKPEGSLGRTAQPDSHHDPHTAPELYGPPRVKNKERKKIESGRVIVQEMCESRGGRPGLSVLTNLLVSVDVKQY